MRIVLIAFASLMFIACDGGSKVSGGGSTGTEAGNAVTARVVGVDLLPVAFTQVRLMSSDAIVGVDETGVSEKTTTNENGVFTFSDLPKGKYTIEIIGVNSASQLMVSLSGEEGLVDKGLDTLMLFGRVHGTLDSISAGGRIVAQGLNHFVTVGSNGSYALDSLPSGPSSLVFVPQQSEPLQYGYLNVSAGVLVTAPTDIFAPEDNGLLLENFEDGDSQHRFGPYVGGGWWFISNHPDVMVTFDSTANTSFPIVDTDHSKALHFYVNVPTSISSPWATCGVQVGENYGSYDFTDVDSIAFRARGTGSLFLELLGRETDALEASDTTGAIPQVSLTLDTTWTRYSVSVNAMHGKEKQIANVRVIAWVFTQSAELWLDDVELIGITKEELWK
jgi:hypothetical protein